MHTITRTHEIACGHTVTGHEGKCAHLHGHNYTFELTLAADELDTVGRVLDFSVVKAKLCTWLEQEWDHRFLVSNRDDRRFVLESLDPQVVIVPFNPTAENMAAFLVETVAPGLLHGTGARLVRCRVWETAKCSATYEVTR
jgi:6-pyruvoyltetrahydropterin/6-carboxytetrahydropterin synthase